MAILKAHARTNFAFDLVSFLVALVIAFGVGGCTSREMMQLDVREEPSNRMIHITVANGANEPVYFSGHVLDASNYNGVKIEVAGMDETIMPMCKGIDYIGESDERALNAGARTELVIPIAAIALTHCLNVGSSYRLRATFVGKVGERMLEEQSAWTDFRIEKIE